MQHPWLTKADPGRSFQSEPEELAGAFRADPETESSDEQLLDRIRQADPRAVMEAYDRYQSRVYQFALHMSGDPEAAADVTQDVFLMMLELSGLVGRLFARFDPRKGSLEGYLLGVARKRLRKLSIRQSRWLPIVDELPVSSGLGLGEEIESRSMLIRLHDAIKVLPMRYREVIVLCCLQEKSYADAAAILRCSQGTVASRLSRGRNLLSQRLQQKPVTHSRNGAPIARGEGIRP